MEDLEQIKEILIQCKKNKNIQPDKIESMPYIDQDKMTIEEKFKYEKIGKEIIKNEEYTVVTMAGGQRNKTRT